MNDDTPRTDRGGRPGADDDGLYRPREHYTRDHDAREEGPADAPRVAGRDGTRPPRPPSAPEGGDDDPPA